ncbi:MAG: lysophospholipid acyltransferase family protein [Candidatus Buchananbacteria bacterium]
MTYKIIKFLFAPIIKLLWIKKVEGLENIPETDRIILASNHESYFDFICLAAISPRPVYFLAGEVFFKKWYFRPLMKMTGQIRVDRNQKDKSQAVNKALEILEREKVFGIFPEGTRSADGKLQKAYTGVAKIALKSKSKVIPVGMIGTFEIMSRHDKYPKFKKCKIKIGKAINLSQYYGKEEDKEVLINIADKIIMPQIAKLTGEEYNF